MEECKNCQNLENGSIVLIKEDGSCMTCGRPGPYVPSPTPSEKQPDWRERLKKEFPGLFYKELTMRGVSSNYDARKELESFIEQTLKEERERIIALGEGMKLPWKHDECQKGQCEICEDCHGRMNRNHVLSDFITKIKM